MPYQRHDAITGEQTYLSATNFLSTKNYAVPALENADYLSVKPTPIVPLANSFLPSNLKAFIKLEQCNPTGSIKYRPANFIIRTLVEKGVLNSSSTVIESSSGNMGAALAYVCREFGIRFICVVDPRAQQANLDLIQRFGGEIDLVKTALNKDFLSARIKRVQELVDRTPNSYWTNQYANPLNQQAHFKTTAKEIFDEFGSQLDALFVATSSTGTYNGIAQFFRKFSPTTQVVAVDAQGSVLYGGSAGERKISGMGAGIVTPLSKQSTPDILYRISDIECVQGCHSLFLAEGHKAGGSTGAVYQALAKHQYDYCSKKVLLLSADGGDKYSNTIYNRDWVNSLKDGLWNESAGMGL